MLHQLRLLASVRSFVHPSEDSTKIRSPRPEEFLERKFNAERINSHKADEKISFVPTGDSWI